MAAGEDFQGFLDTLSNSLLAVTRTSGQLATEDVDFHRSLNPRVGTKLDRQNARLLDLARRLLGNAVSGSEAVRPRLSDLDSVDEQWRTIVDVLDSLLESADTSLDEFSGAVRRLSPSREQTPSTPPRMSRIAAALLFQDMVKPQLAFEHAVTNDDAPPFVPLLATKPHAKVALKDSLKVYQGSDELSHLPHPYKREIDEYEYPPFVYTRAEPIMYTPFDSTTATLVDTPEALDEMLQELKQAKEIAIDLEHHDLRSYIGLVSLMQISTRNRDWIVDTLKPWRRKLSVLNEVFADPSILKVLHGAHMDSIWLQRDLGLYLVGLFDTHHACRVLGYPGGSLAFLLKKFINFDAQKQYQTADWRIRPLPTELFDYARSDTHFLLYIYDNMRNELLDRSNLMLEDPDQDKVAGVLKRSQETALQVYNHPVYDYERGLGTNGWYKMLSRTPAPLSKSQFHVFRAVHSWRDRIAREQDDGIHYVLPNHQILTLAKEMPLERPKLFGMLQPLSQTVKLRADELLATIRDASENADDAPEMMAVLKKASDFKYGEGPDGIVPAAMATQPTPAERAVEAPTAVAATPLTPVTALRSMVSTLWGKTMDQPPKRGMSTLAPRMVIPLPSAEDLAGFDSPTAAATTTPSPARPPPAATTPKERDVFSIRNTNKRKAEQAAPEADGLATQHDEVTIADEADDEVDKARRRAERKAARRAKRRSEVDQADSEEGREEEGAFDYAAAPSVFGSANVAAGKGAGKERRAKEEKRNKVEPFGLAKGLMDAPRGLGRKQKESAGRSMTFKK